MIFSEKKAYDLLTVAAGIILVAIAICSSGTGDDGDSVQHYLFARYAFEHPENFFDHWAKPIYVMIAAPFAQMGFVGAKVLNVLLLTGQIWVLGKIARHLDLKNAWLLPIFSLAAPMNLTHTNSGLTEPLFAFWLAAPMLLLLRGRVGWAYFLWSFLPLVRSEGLIIFCPLVIYMMLRGHWRWLPMLAAGHILVSLAGLYWHNGDPFWVITQIPYANLSNSDYGSGPWLHYVEKMPLIIGSTLTVLLVIGLFDAFFRLILTKKWLKPGIGRDEAWLIHGFFLAFLVAHSIFWALGIFNSYGLLRVFLGIMPCLLIICLIGTNRLLATVFLLIKNRRAQLAIVAGLAIFIPSRTYKRMSWEYEFGPTTQQLAIANAAKAIKSDFPDLSGRPIYAGHPDIHRALELDYFDKNVSRRPAQVFSGEALPANSIVIFDDWYMGNMWTLSYEKLQNDPRLMLRGVFDSGRNRWDDGHKIRVFYVDSTKAGVGGQLLHNPLDTFGALQNGRNCLKLDGKYVFSPSLTGRAGDFKIDRDFIISFDICQPDTTDQSAASLVFQMETAGGEVHVWRCRELKQDLRAAHGEWRSYKLLEKMPAPKSPTDKIGIYLMNPHANPVFLDNLEIK